MTLVQGRNEVDADFWARWRTAHPDFAPLTDETLFEAGPADGAEMGLAAQAEGEGIAKLEAETDAAEVVKMGDAEAAEGSQPGTPAPAEDPAPAGPVPGDPQ